MTFSRTPRHPHLVLPGSGLSDELYWLRQQVADALAVKGIERHFIIDDTLPPQDNRFADWGSMFAAIDQLPFGEVPVVMNGKLGAPLVAPGLGGGQPVDGWDLRGGRFASPYGATGACILDLATNNVKLNNCFGFGTGGSIGEGSIVVQIAPPPGEGVLNFSLLSAGGAFIFVLGGGCAIDHTTSAGALMRSPGALSGTTMVMVCSGSQTSVFYPALSGPFVELQGDDGAVGVQIQTANGLPDGWLAGGGPFSALLSIHDEWANAKTRNIAAWVPGFTGGGGSTEFSFTKAHLLGYQPGAPGNWAGTPPDTVGEALDRLAAANPGA